MKPLGENSQPPMMILPMAQEAPPGAGEFRIPSVDQSFVTGMVSTGVGMIPKVDGSFSRQDRVGHYLVRWNIGRDSFIVEPGLYALGDPDADSPVLVTANYKLTFDLLRHTLAGRNCWIMALDTKGINVWCAAGKGTFGTEEMLDRIQATRLAEIVSHRRLIVPQLGAPGLAAFEIKKHAGFKVIYGPVMMDDLPAFLDDGCRVTPEMRIKKFPFQERLVLAPVEFMQGMKQGLPLVCFFLLVGGFFGDGLFLSAVLRHGLPPSLAVLIGIIAGNIIVPLFLPWIPVKPFSLKGAITGLALFCVLFVLFGVYEMGYPLPVQMSLLLITLAVSSWLGMAFTGASTYTSLNGVRKEMLVAMPCQFIALLAGVGIWVASLWLW